MTQPSYALVTGASRGLGKYFARTLAARQQNVVLVARDKDRLATLAAELKKTYGIRAEMLALSRLELDKRNLPFALIRGDRAARLAAAITAVTQRFPELRTR